MCGCEPGFTCTRCAGTTHDPAYMEEPDRDDERASAERDAETVWLLEGWLGSVVPR